MTKSERLSAAFCAVCFSVLAFAGCTTVVKVQPTPSDAEVSVKNTITQEIFKLGQGKVEISPKPEYGPAFLVSVSKEGFVPREVMVSPSPGASTDYFINLKTIASDPTAKREKEIDDAIAKKVRDFEEKVKEIQNDLKERVASWARAAEENMRFADEQRRQAMLDKMRAEIERKNVESDKKIKVLEGTFDIYKDALFSERYALGPASNDRRKIDTTVDSVNRIQQMIDEKRYVEAEKLIDKVLEKDEYLAKGYSLKGTVKYLLNKTNESMVAWERAMELDPTDKASQRQLAALYLRTGRMPAGSLSNGFGTQNGRQNPSPAGKQLPQPPALRVRDR